MINTRRTSEGGRRWRVYHITKCLANNARKQYHTSYIWTQRWTSRVCRFVIKYLHFSWNVSEIRNELARKGHKVRSVIKGRNIFTKEPFNLLFVHLQSANNNKDIYKIQFVQKKNIEKEPPRNLRGITQCTRFRQYCHTKSYCTGPYVCVKCGGSPNTANCKKNIDSLVRCAIYDGLHPASYKNYKFYHKLLKPNNTNHRLTKQQYANVPLTDSHNTLSFSNTIHNNAISVSSGQLCRRNKKQHEAKLETALVRFWT